MLVSEEEQESTESFYSPLCKSKPYLTPEQRRKLREKRKTDISPVTTSCDKSLKLNKNVRRFTSQKPKTKLTYKKALQKKLTKVNLPGLSCSAAELLSQDKKSTENKKFFKTRSPEHLKKAKFVLKYKKARLEFGEAKHSVIRDSSNNFSPPKPINIDTFDKCSHLNETVTENPCIVKVASFQNDIAESTQEKTADILGLDSSRSAPSIDKMSPEVVKAEIPASVSNSCPNSVQEKESITSEPKPKNYPIFDKENIKKIKWDLSPPGKIFNESFLTKDKSKGSEQMIIDAGQNKIGAIMCKTCNMVYTIGHEEDEKLHSQNHDMYLNLKFPGWKDERVIGNYSDGRIIKILKDDKNFKLKKVQDILQLVNRDLGFLSPVFTEYLKGSNIMILLFISTDKFVKGCLVAESITSASPVLKHENGSSKSYYASSDTVRAICGINRIWVARHFRKQKIASRMVDCLRSNFILGIIVSLEELAFTDPTEDGMQFAASYTGTENFLVYK